ITPSLYSRHLLPLLSTSPRPPTSILFPYTTLFRSYFFKNLKDGKVESHPNTFEKFQDFKIPFYNESCELAINLHESLYGIHSIGWDIAITPDGPLIIKGNDNWNVAMQQLFYKKEIKKRI